MQGKKKHCKRIYYKKSDVIKRHCGETETLLEERHSKRNTALDTKILQGKTDTPHKTLQRQDASRGEALHRKETARGAAGDTAASWVHQGGRGRNGKQLRRTRHTLTYSALGQSQHGLVTPPCPAHEYE